MFWIGLDLAAFLILHCYIGYHFFALFWIWMGGWNGALGLIT